MNEVTNQTELGGLSRVGLVALGYWAVLSTLACLFYPVTVFDPLVRYAPMAEAFARGDYFMAYHPRFGVLFTTLAGCVCRLTGLKGDCACQIVSFFFLAFAAVPIWAIMKRVFGKSAVAWWSVALVLGAPEYFILAQDGLRDTVRIFGLACCVLSFIGPSVWPIAVGLFCLVTVRTDLFLISGAVLVAYLVVARFSGRKWFPAVLAWLSGAFLMCWMTSVYTGHWLPGAQFVKLYLKCTGGTL